MASLLLATTFLFIRHGGRGIKGESCSTLLMLRLAQARFLHVYERCYISGSQERFCLFYTRDFLRKRKYIYLDSSEGDSTKSYVRPPTIVFLTNVLYI